jgi:hypothetical protein
MEKTIFLFKRHANRSREDFAQYYIHNHAPLGAKLTRSLLGYTVNIVENEEGPDAITEHWLGAAMDLLTPDIAYATREDFDAIVADDRTLFSHSLLHVVVEENSPTAELREAPLGTQTPEIKFIWLYADARSAPPPPQGARRVVDNRVGYKLVFEDGERKQVAPDFELIRMAWAASADALGQDVADAIIAKEYRFIPAPRWPVA